ncbi:MAG: hypothetical protein IKG77_08795 [Prevotella sp.]|nr:hypothetical protein [Prevotella sp.]
MNMNNNYNENETVQAQPGNNPAQQPPYMQQPTSPQQPPYMQQPEPPQQPPYMQEPSGQATRLAKRKKTNGAKTWWLVAMIVLLVAAIGAGAYYFLSQDKSRPHAFNDDEEETLLDDEDATDEDTMEEEEDAYDMRRHQQAPEEEAAEDDRPTPPAPNANGPQTLELKGDADGYPLTLSLQINANGRVTGSYKNLSEGTTMQLSGTKNGDAILLTGNADRTRYTFRIRPDGRLYVGTFEKAGGSTLELHLTEQK